MYRDLGENISGGGKKGIRKKPVNMTNIGEQAGAELCQAQTSLS